MTGAKRIRVLQICPSDHPPFAELTAAYHRAIDLAGAEVTTLFLAPPFAQPQADTCYLNVAGLNARRALRRALRGWVVQDKGGYQLIICHRYRAWRAARMLARQLQYPRLIVVAHEFGMFSRLARRITNWRALRDSATWFAGVSQAVTDELARYVPHTMTLLNVVDPTMLDREWAGRDAARRQLGVLDDSFLFVVLGRLHRKKNPQLAIDAFRLLPPHLMARARLVFVGEGAERVQLERNADNERVQFAGFIPHARRLLTAADAVVMTSTDVEAFGMTALEAMAAGVPVIAGPAPGPRAVLGEVGYYYGEATPKSLCEAMTSRMRSGIPPGFMQQCRARVQRYFSTAALAHALQPYLEAASEETPDQP